MQDTAPTTWRDQEGGANLDCIVEAQRFELTEALKIYLLGDSPERSKTRRANAIAHGFQSVEEMLEHEWTK